MYLASSSQYGNGLIGVRHQKKNRYCVSNSSLLDLRKILDLCLAFMRQPVQHIFNCVCIHPIVNTFPRTVCKKKHQTYLRS